jgi:hypothetical protein
MRQWYNPAIDVLRVTTYKVSFAPNPSRRHTRARRGKHAEGFTTEQRDFEEAADLADHHSKKLKSHQRSSRRRSCRLRSLFVFVGLRARISLI